MKALATFVGLAQAFHPGDRSRPLVTTGQAAWMLEFFATAHLTFRVRSPRT